MEIFGNGVEMCRSVWRWTPMETCGASWCHLEFLHGGDDGWRQLATFGVFISWKI